MVRGYGSLSWDLASIFPNMEMCITAKRRVDRHPATYNIECAGFLAVREMRYDNKTKVVGRIKEKMLNQK